MGSDVEIITDKRFEQLGEDDSHERQYNLALRAVGIPKMKTSTQDTP